jgi:hypothetical protein
VCVPVRIRLLFARCLKEALGDFDVGEIGVGLVGTRAGGGMGAKDVPLNVIACLEVRVAKGKIHVLCERVADTGIKLLPDVLPAPL